MADTADAVGILERIQKEDPSGGIRGVCAMLLEICRAEPGSAAVLAEDLESGSMAPKEAYRKIEARAREIHREAGGTCVCVASDEAEKILREFYRLPPRDGECVTVPVPAPAPDPGIDFAAFLSG